MSEAGTAAAKKKQDFAAEALAKYGKKTQTTTAVADDATKAAPATARFANIQANPFYKVLFESKAAPTEKQAAYAAALAYDATKTDAENQARDAAHEEFKEYLLAYAKDQAMELIRLSDTKSSAELQQVLNYMNQGLLDFETLITPMMETIEAIHQLNNASDGMMYDVFKEIKEDEVEEKRIAALREELNQKLSVYERDVQSVNNDVAELKGSFFSAFKGGKIARKEEELSVLQGGMADLQAEIEKTVMSRETKFAEYAEQKEKLRTFMNLASEAHIKQQQALKDTAANFVTTTDTQSAKVLERMKDIKVQADKTDDVNGRLQRAFTIIKGAENGATAIDEKLAETFSRAAEKEDELEKLERESRLSKVNEHVTILNEAQSSTLLTVGKIQDEATTIKSLKDKNRQQIKHIREINSSGTASVASRLLSTLSAFSSACLNEAKVTTQNTLKNMDDKTRAILNQEVIQAAVGMHLDNRQLYEMIEEMKGTRENMGASLEIAREALKQQEQLRVDFEAQSKQLDAALKESKGVTAEVLFREGGVKSVAAGNDNEGKAAAPAPKPSGLENF